MVEWLVLSFLSQSLQIYHRCLNQKLVHKPQHRWHSNYCRYPFTTCKKLCTNSWLPVSKLAQLISSVCTTLLSVPVSSTHTKSRGYCKILQHISHECCSMFMLYVQVIFEVLSFFLVIPFWWITLHTVEVDTHSCYFINFATDLYCWILTNQSNDKKLM